MRLSGARKLSFAACRDASLQGLSCYSTQTMANHFRSFQLTPGDIWEMLSNRFHLRDL